MNYYYFASWYITVNNFTVHKPNKTSVLGYQRTDKHYRVTESLYTIVGARKFIHKKPHIFTIKIIYN